MSSKYEDELDQSLEILFQDHESIEEPVIQCRNLLFTPGESPASAQVKEAFFNTIKKEGKDEIGILWKSVEGASDLNVAATVEYIVSGYDLFDDDEKSLMVMN